MRHGFALVANTTVACILTGSGSVSGDSHTWTGTDSTSYSDGDNWTPVGPPAHLDTVYITDPSTRDTCILDAALNVTLTGLELEGDSPTKMTFYVRDKTLTVNSSPCKFLDYSMLKADQDVTTEYHSELAGEVWFEVAPTDTEGVTVHLIKRTDVVVDGTTTLNLDDHSVGVFLIDKLYVDASAGSANRTLKVAANNSTATILDLLSLTSDPYNDRKAKLWHAAGTLLIESNDSVLAIFDVNGGPNGFRKAEVDIDATFRADRCEFSQYVDVDVASGLTAYGGEVIFAGGGRYAKSGSGVFKSGSAP